MFCNVCPRRKTIRSPNYCPIPGSHFPPDCRSASTASTCDGCLLTVCEKRGWDRHYKRADNEVAQSLKTMALIAERRAHTAAWSNPTRQRLHLAPMLLQAFGGAPRPRCLTLTGLVRARRDHMAGKLPKALLAHCPQRGRLRRYDSERALAITPRGRKLLASLLPSVSGF